MMVHRMLSDVAGKLSDLDFTLELTLEASVEYLALRRFEAVHKVRNGSHVVVVREKNVLLVQEFRELDTFLLD